MWIDIGCNDFEGAALNRVMVAEKRNVAGYVQVEIALSKIPLRCLLPDWIPRGNLIYLRKGELKAWGIRHLTNYLEHAE